MMFEGKHIHYSPVDNKPLCSYSAKLCKQRRLNGYAFCIRHILEDKSAPFKQCAHVARYNNQKCTNPIPSNENREFCNSHMQVAGILPKKERKNKKEKEKELIIPSDGKLKFADRLRALLKKENSVSCNEDPFNADDPYAFPDPVESERLGNVGSTAVPIPRTTWNCSQKICSETPPSENALKSEQFQPRSNTSGDCKLKSHTPKLSKTMNRLHAKIAQNKLLDKLKKYQDSSQNILNLSSGNTPPSSGSIKSESLSPVRVASTPVQSIDQKPPELLEQKIVSETLITDSAEDSITATALPSSASSSHSDFQLCSGANSSYISSLSNHQPLSPKDTLTDSPQYMPKVNKILMKPKHNQIKAQETGNKMPHALQRLQNTWEDEKKTCRDLYPLGFDTSDSEGSDCEEGNNILNHLYWFCAMDRKISSTQKNHLNSRISRQSCLKMELQQCYQQVCRLQKLHRQETRNHNVIVNHLIEAARFYPNRMAHILLKHLKSISRPKKNLKPLGLDKRMCCYRHDDSSCNHTALPYTRHCEKHIMYNVDQLLFEHCTAKFADNTQCCIPVFDICHELPLCPEHAKKRMDYVSDWEEAGTQPEAELLQKDNYNKMASEPKPKKARKKPKPSALTRPAKRNKKKKRHNQLRPSLPSSPSSPSPEQQTNNSHIEMSGSIGFDGVPLGSGNGPLTAEDIAKDLGDHLDSDLGSDLEGHFSPGTIDKSLELPLDTAELANQATKLLEEHDFTEVLNKIPDDAFNDLFVETRNGEYVPTKEETEELERALAAVSKDVHLAKESLAKLSATGQDIDELESSIDIHGSLLSAENLTSAIDENTFHELAQGHMDSLNVITSNLSTSDLHSLTQALSSMTSDNLAQSSLPPVSDGHLIQGPVAAVPLLASEVSQTHVLNGHSGSLAGIHSLHQEAGFSLGPQFLEGSAAATSLSVMNPTSSQGSSDSRFVSSSSLLSTVLFGLGQASASGPQTAFSTTQASALTPSNSSEDTGLITSSGGLTSTHWLLNSSEPVLTLSHMGYQNGFLVTSQGGPTCSGAQQLLTSVGKYPLQALSAEVSLVSSSSPLVTTTNCNESVICGASEQPIHTLNLPTSPTVSLQQTSSAAVIAQEGAS